MVKGSWCGDETNSAQYRVAVILGGAAGSESPNGQVRLLIVHGAKPRPVTWRSTSLNGSAVDRSQQADGNVYPRGLTASSRHAAVTVGETALYGCVAEWKRQQGYAVQESAAHSNLLGLKQPPRTGIKLVAYCLHHAGFKSSPHPPKRPFVGVVALSTNKVQPSAATA